nr:polysaccharide biosynthesis protein [Clostridia bacterium]
MKKRVLYYSCLIVGDFVAFLGIAILANLLINKDFSKINIAFILSALVICVLKVLVGILFKTYRLLWMFSIKRNLFKLAIVNISADLVFFLLSISPSVANFTGFTMSIVESAVLMEFAYLIISRFAVSVYLNYFYKSKDKTGKKLVRTLIVGAGNAGAMVLNELGTSNEFGYNIVGFVDDSEDKIGTYISNVKVFGPISDVNNIAIKQGAKKIVIALPSAGFAKMKEITNIIDYKKFDVEILPDKSKLLQDNLKGSIRRVSICDLLGRKPVELDKTKLNDFINNKVVLVTGGGGSIGSEICRQVLDYNPKKLIIFDIYENTTYELKTELDFKYRLKEPKPDYLALIGSV